jgi:hypothetical protein
MSRLSILAFAAFTFVLSAAFISRIDLEKKLLLNDRIELKIPKDFTVMSDEMLKIKYPNENRPKLVYTNETGGINVALSLTANPASQKTLPDLVEQFEKVFKNVYPSADWKGTGVDMVNEQKVGYIELVTPAMDTEIYNLIFFTDLDGKLVMFTFNCTKKDMSKWESTAKEIMNSLRII